MSSALTDFHFLSYAFIQRAYLAGSFIAALCAMLGLFLVLRKLSLMGDGLSHVSFGAIALGLFFGFYPFYSHPRGYNRFVFHSEAYRKSEDVR